MNYVSLNPSSVITMLFVIYSEIWAPLILGESEDDQHFIAFLAREVVEDWELLCCVQFYISSAQGYDLPLFYLNSLRTRDVFIRCHSLKDE